MTRPGTGDQGVLRTRRLLVWLAAALAAGCTKLPSADLFDYATANERQWAEAHPDAGADSTGADGLGGDTVSDDALADDAGSDATEDAMPADAADADATDADAAATDVADADDSLDSLENPDGPDASDSNDVDDVDDVDNATDAEDAISSDDTDAGDPGDSADTAADDVPADTAEDATATADDTNDADGTADPDVADSAASDDGAAVADDATAAEDATAADDVVDAEDAASASDGAGADGDPGDAAAGTDDAANGDDAVIGDDAVNLDDATGTDDATGDSVDTAGACDPEECDDGNVCTTDTCADGVCAHAPVTTLTSCGAGMACADGGVCSALDPVAMASWPTATFAMGDDGPDAPADAAPVHEVTLSGFQLDVQEVTVGQYAQFLAAMAKSAPALLCNGGNDGVLSCLLPDEATGCTWPQGGDTTLPLNCVDWWQADAYCAWAGKRLPTEAEWEFAARSGGQSNLYPWGATPADCSLAILDDGGSGCGTGAPWTVCSRPAGKSADGLCDLAGNLAEWCSDWYGAYDAASVVDPSGPANSAAQEHVTRGGSWSDGAPALRSSSRASAMAPYRTATLGFRCARSVLPP